MKSQRSFPCHSVREAPEQISLLGALIQRCYAEAFRALYFFRAGRRLGTVGVCFGYSQNSMRRRPFLTPSFFSHDTLVTGRVASRAAHRAETRSSGSPFHTLKSPCLSIASLARVSLKGIGKVTLSLSIAPSHHRSDHRATEIYQLIWAVIATTTITRKRTAKRPRPRPLSYSRLPTATAAIMEKAMAITRIASPIIPSCRQH
jgi:hypothetical protein